MCAKFLKEWGTVIKALESGDQTIILRKGGILETASGFKIESQNFVLFPTWEHQEFEHIKPEYHKYLQDVKSNKPPAGFNKITSCAKVLAQADVSDPKTIQRLSVFHVWSDSYIHQRMNWMPEKPLKAVFLKVRRLVTPIDIPLVPQYQGCKSWIDINDDTSLSGFDGKSNNINSSKQVLLDSQLNTELDKFKEIVN